MAPELPDRRTRMELLKKTLDQRRPDFDKLLSAFTVSQKERYFQVLLTALRDPNIAECAPVSIVDAMLKSAQWGLAVDGTHSALVAFKGQCQFMPMYRGMLVVARRSGDIREVWSEVVLDGEAFVVTMGTTPDLAHVPDMLRDRSDSSQVVAAYACARWREGGAQFAVLSRAELDKARRVSRAQSDRAPWATWETEMMKKTAVRRLMKMLPIGDTYSELIDEDEKNELDIRGPSVPTTARAKPKSLDDLAVPESGKGVVQTELTDAIPAEEYGEPLLRKD